MKILAVIPARFGATRLPGKPLAVIAGKPMIQHVYEQASSATNVDHVIVATDDERIVSACEKFGAEALMTPPELPSGTDRVAFVARLRPEFDGVLNVQGDEPAIEPETIFAVAGVLRDTTAEITTAVTPFKDISDLDNPNAVKAVVAQNGLALYFSRAHVPFVRHPEHTQKNIHFRHLGIYGFRRETLLKLTELKLSPLEQTESLEQLRWLEAGYVIRCVQVNSRSIGVDTADDLKTASAILQTRETK